MDTYLMFKHPHMLAAALFVLLFLLRGWLLFTQAPALQARLLRILPHVLATVLLLTGLGMVHALGIFPVWAGVKLATLVLVMVCSAMTFQRAAGRRAQLAWFLAGLAGLVFIVAVAVRKQLPGLLG
ncbi:SirB2 family protein [Amnimonas aquatica]|uniref:Regulator SirB n=1 Tax=Amnimonas aquatica TaxID=2094561 RepID=A0A2P6AUK3_9GAMM|nr:SirB2 family protein [Amnimonas aquatica]PQA50815.1 regulator SirB [Amnimonas aquatica]